MGSTRPVDCSSPATSSSAATGSPSTSVSPARIRFPTECPASAPLPPNRCWRVRAHTPSGSAASAASAIRRSPGGNTPSSARSLPGQPPHRAECRVEAVSATEGDDRGAGFPLRHSRPRSRCTTRTTSADSAEVSAPISSPSASAIATLRCLPPVQPTATVMYRFPSWR
ncbi:Uncharacterised protein [Mycobacteroides abscessus subsp. abscessus]|nr:Uncharacterised protein [Mycobacteroides abscessus subsp. abscessus]